MREEKKMNEENALPDEALDGVTGGADAPPADKDKTWKPDEKTNFWDNVKDYFGLKR